MKYWLAPERRAETFAYFETFFAWWMRFSVRHDLRDGLTMRANFSTPPRLPTGPIVTVL